MSRYNPKLLKPPYQLTLLKSHFFVSPNSTHLDNFNKEQSRLMNLQFLVHKKRNLYLCTHKTNNLFQHKIGVLMTKYFEDYLLLRVKTTG